MTERRAIPEAVSLYYQNKVVGAGETRVIASAEADNGRDLVRINGVIHPLNGTYENLERAIRDMEARGVTEADAFINSPGGCPFEGWACYDLIKSSKIKFTAYVHGMAASAASFIALACDKTFIGKNARFMIHEGVFGVTGRVKEVEIALEIGRSVNAQMSETYSAVSGKSREEVDGLMADETWYLGAKAVEAGFIGGVVDAEFAACVDEETLRTFEHTPQELIDLLHATAEDEEIEGGAVDGDVIDGVDEGSIVTIEAPALEEPAPVEDPAALSAEEQNKIIAACSAFEMPEKAAGFIEARAQIADVRASLWNASAEADQATQTDAAILPVETNVIGTPNPLNAIRAKALRAVQGIK